MFAHVMLAVGHGRRPNGSFDPGAVAPDGTREYDLNRAVTKVAARVLADGFLGVKVDTESDAGATMDPNYVGTTKAENASRPDVIVSVHHDWHRAPRGGFGLYLSANGKALADAIASAWGVSGLPQRGNTKRTDLFLLNQTVAPAVIWECDRVGADVADDEWVERSGVALARGIAGYLKLEPKPLPEVPAPAAPDGVVYSPVSGVDEGIARVLAAWLGVPSAPSGLSMFAFPYVVGVAAHRHKGPHIAVKGANRVETAAAAATLMGA